MSNKIDKKNKILYNWLIIRKLKLAMIKDLDHQLYTEQPYIVH